MRSKTDRHSEETEKAVRWYERHLERPAEALEDGHSTANAGLKFVRFRWVYQLTTSKPWPKVSACVNARRELSELYVRHT